MSLNTDKPEGEKFLISELDDRHLFIKSDAVDWVRQQLKEYQHKITYAVPRRGEK